MLYRNDFVSQSFNVKPLFVKRNAFTVTLNNNIERKTLHRYSIAYALKPLLCISSVFAVNSVKYSKSGIRQLTLSNKIYSLFIIVLYTTLTALIKSRDWDQASADLPFDIVSKLFFVFHFLEIAYNLFIVAFCNSYNYMRLLRTIDDIDNHFIITRKLFIKRRIFATIFILIPLILTSFGFLFLKVNVNATLIYVSFTLIMLQGVNHISSLLIIYSSSLNFNAILSKKVREMSSVKKLIFKNDFLANFINKMLSDPFHTEFTNGYCWFELMQIYDKISDCIYLSNKIYAGQIFLMFNSWLLSTLVVICRSISPIFKKTHAVRGDLYFYVFTNIRPVLVTLIGERFIRERRKTLLIIEHILIYHDLGPEYRSQVKTMLSLVQMRELQITAIVCPVNVPVMITFANQIISLSVLMIQKFYIKLLLRN